MPDDEPDKNPFVRFKQHVDANVGAGLESLFGFANSMATNSRPHTQTAMSFASSGPARGDGSARSASSQEPAGSSFGSPGPAGSAQPASRRPDPGAYAHAWHDFLLWSPYSPIALRDLGLSPLSHRYYDDADFDDLPFTFLDAFEDLMYAASGRPMPDLEHRRRQAESVSVYWPAVVGPRRADWSERFRNMAMAGVLDAYPVLSEEKRAPWRFTQWGQAGHPTYSAGQGLESDSEQPTVTQREWPRSGQEDRGAERWESKAVTQRPASSQDSQISDAGLFGELDRVFKTLGKVLEDEVGSFPLFGRRSTGQQDSEASQDRQDGKAPRTEDDLYSAVQSAYSAAERSLSTFLKSVSEGQFKGESSSSWSGSSSTSFDGQADQGPAREVTSTNEYVDRYGYLHTKTETKRLNAQGEEIGRETHYSVRPQMPAPGDRQETSKGGFINEGWPPQPEEEPQKPRRKGGWFW